MPRKVQTSETSAPPAPATKKVIAQGDAAAIAARFKDFPNIEVLKRQMANPSDPGSLPILLKDESSDCCVNSDHMNRLRPGATKCHVCRKPARQWYVRWANFAQEGRAGQIRAKGYVGVEIADLQDTDDVADLFRSSKDTLVRRGDRGQEILVKRPLEVHNFIKAKQAAAWNTSARSAKKIRASLADAAGRELGDEAGQTIHDGGIDVTVTRRRGTLGGEAEVDDEELIDA
jgi:hypothetical protein